MSKETSLQTLYSIDVVCSTCGARHNAPDLLCACGALLVKGMLPGAIIAGRYRYLDTIGNGGMGLVVKAFDPEGDCDVAIKLLLRNNNSGEVQRFMRECQATKIIEHEAIIKVKQYGVTGDGFPYMAMEYVPGGDLADLIARKGALELQEALEIFWLICDTMTFAHGKGVIHRDIKPSNIMLPPSPDRRRRIKIVDFGIAKVTRTNDLGLTTNQTQTGQIVGSPLFMSPEQSLGKSVDHRADIYSAACVLYHMLTGAPPLHGDSAIETLFKHVNEVPLSLTQASLGRQFTPGIEAVVARSLRKNPDDRQQSFEQLKSELHQALNNEFSLTQTGLSHQVGEDKPGANRRLIKLIAAAVFAVVLIVGILVVVVNNFSAKKTSAPTAPPVTLSDSDFTSAHADLATEATQQAFAGNALKGCLRNSLVDQYHPGEVKLTEPFYDDNAIKILLREANILKKSFTALCINKCNIGDEGVRLVAESNQQIKYLRFEQTNITGKSLQLIARIPTLEKLQLVNCKHINAADLKHLAKARHLKFLEIKNVCHGAKEGDFAFLSKLSSLCTLTLNNNSPLPAGMFKYLEMSPNLTTLNVQNSNLTDQSLDDISNIATLEQLEVRDPNFTDAGIKKLANLRGLTYLLVGGGALTTNSLPTFVKMHNLTELELVKLPGVSSVDLERLSKEMPKCSIRYDVDGKQPTGNVLRWNQGAGN